jgi:pilus assembly protein CpaB
MNKSVVMIMGGALAIAIVVAMIVQAKLAPKKEELAATTGVEVLVASRAISTGEIPKAADVHWESVPDKMVFTGMIKRKEQTDETTLEVYNKPLRRDIQSGEPVTTQALVDSKGSGNFLSASLTPGMRAMGIPVKAETMAGGFVAPGDFVDVVLTFQLNVRGNAANYSAEMVQRFASETILSNVRVLAVDQDSKEGAHEAKVARTVTLEVDKEGAQVLAMASSMGQLTLSLRRLGEKDSQTDKSSPLTTDVTSSKTIKGIYNLMGKSKSVRLYGGAAVENIPVRATAESER